MATLQGELLSRIAAANRRLNAAEANLEDAKAALKRTREADALARAKAELKAAALELCQTLDETLQLELPGACAPDEESAFDAAAWQRGHDPVAQTVNGLLRAMTA